MNIQQLSECSDKDLGSEQEVAHAQNFFRRILKETG
jgi:hypothetical protein